MGGDQRAAAGTAVESDPRRIDFRSGEEIIDSADPVPDAPVGEGFPDGEQLTVEDVVRRAEFRRVRSGELQPFPLLDRVDREDGTSFCSQFCLKDEITFRAFADLVVSGKHHHGGNFAFALLRQIKIGGNREIFAAFKENFFERIFRELLHTGGPGIECALFRREAVGAFQLPPGGFDQSERVFAGGGAVDHLPVALHVFAENILVVTLEHVAVKRERGLLS